MMTHAILDGTRVLRLVTEDEAGAVLLVSPQAHWPEAPHDSAELRCVDGELHWHDPRTLDEAKAQKNAEINEARLRANRSGFVFAGRLISTDELSRSDIDGTNGSVALTGDFPTGWPGYWKAEDNSYVAIPDVATWTAFYAAMVAQGATNFATAQALKAQLAAATTIAEVDAISWP